MTKKLFGFLVLILLALFGVAGCTLGGRPDFMASRSGDAAPGIIASATKPLPGRSPGSPAISTEGKNRLRLIKTARVRFRVEEYNRSRPALLQAVEKAGAYLQNEQESSAGRGRECQLVIRVPADRFETLLETLLKESIYLHEKQIEAEDITEQFTDLQARLKAKQEAEGRFIDILRRSGTIKDVLEVEQALRQVREEIEAQQGRLRYLSDQVAFSTINLIFYQAEEEVPSPEERFWAKTGSALAAGFELLQGIFLGLLSFWPIWLILFLLVWGYRRWRRGRVPRDSAPAGEPAEKSAEPPPAV